MFELSNILIPTGFVTLRYDPESDELCVDVLSCVTLSMLLPRPIQFIKMDFVITKEGVIFIDNENERR
jgi:hypothetical protein